jgi:dihydroxy-acid dehydratase
MSGTGFGTVVLHVSPEAAAGGNFAVVRTGDTIELDIPNRSLNVVLSDEELTVRKQSFIAENSNINRGYAYLYTQHVEQAYLGADFDFLKGGSGSNVSRDSH